MKPIKTFLHPIVWKILLLIILFLPNAANAQNTTITDSTTYTPHSSAMLDVMSNSKGVLVPRMTSAQRVAISNPANGLLVFDVTEGSFFFYNNSSWHNLSQSSGNIWDISGNNVFLADPNYKVGVGTSTPTAGLTVAGSPATTVNDTLFVVRNKDGEPVFAVFPEGVRVWMEDGAKGNIGGFAVSGRTTGKFETEYFRITPDSVRIYINDSATKGNIGGFAVSGRTTGKSYGDDYLRVTSDSVRIYIDQDNTKANIGGFAVSGRTTGKGTATAFTYLVPKNYFIGHSAGSKTIAGGGQYNSFFGYESGKENAGGSYNVFMGYKTGAKNIAGRNNVFIGYQSGYNNIGNISDTSQGSKNVFIGYLSGFSNTTGDNNTFVGDSSGLKNSIGTQNSYFGKNAGANNAIGKKNTYLGSFAGSEATGGNQNIFIGVYAGNYQSVVGDSNIYMGNNAGRGQSLAIKNQGRNNVLIGTDAGINNLNGSFNVFLGFQTGYNNTNGTNNTFVGYQCGFNNTNGIKNSFYGYMAGRSNTTGLSNLFIGSEAGKNNTTASNNTFLGDRAGAENTTAACNTFIGSGVGSNNTTGYNNTFISYGAGTFNDTGSSNICIGLQAGRKNNNNNNVYIGNNAGYGKKGIKNLCLGNSAGFGGLNEYGNYNVILGNYAGFNLQGDSNVFIGYEAGYNETGSQKLYIDNSSTPIPLIYGDFNANTLKINGSLTFNIGANSVTLPSNRGTNGQALVTNGAGNASWGNPPGSSASNGLTMDVTTTKLGGTLTANTTINQSIYNMVFNLNSTGDFEIKDNGTSALIINDTANVGLSTNTPNSKLQVNGAFSLPITVVSTSITLDNTHYTVLANANDITITLPLANTCKGRIYVIKKTITAGGANVIIDPSGSDVIDGAANKTISAQYETMVIQSGGGNWFIISHLNP